MSHHGDLLRQARMLAAHERQKPKQATLRRAVSTAYYAVFHFLIDEAVRRMVRGRDRATHRELLRRSFDHGEMVKSCRAFIRPPREQPLWLRNSGIAVSADVQLVAEAFDELQRARHEADYNLAARFDRTRTIDLVERAEEAIKAWGRARQGADADLLLIALLARKGFERA